MRWLVVFLVACAHAPVQRADIVIVHGRVLTAHGVSDAIAVRGSKIVAFGAAARAMSTPKRFDAGGQLVFSGFVDSHVHAPVLFDAHEIDGTESDDVATTLTNIEHATHDVPRGTWLHGVLNVDADITQLALDAAAPDHPVWLDNSSGHVVVLNSAAERRLKLAGAPPGGFVDKPGWRSEYARYVAMRLRASLVTDEQIAHAVQVFEREALGFGITAITVFPLDLEADRLFHVLRHSNPRLRWHVVVVPLGFWSPNPSLGNQRVTLEGTKYFIDGMQVERGAALRESYSDSPNTDSPKRDSPNSDRSNRGRIDWSRDDIHMMLLAARATRDTLHLHAVGDRALDTVFEEMEKLGGRWPYLVIEHGYLVDVARAKRLGVTIVMDPVHSEPAALNRRRLGDRVSRWMPMRSLVEAGVPFALGSDGPLDPAKNLALATTHPTNPREALTRDQALRAYSRPLEIGAAADIVVLGRNDRSVLTIIDGEIVLSLASAPSSARTE